MRPPISWTSYLAIRGPKSIYLYSCLLGVLAGLGAIGFQACLHFAESFFLSPVLGSSPYLADTWKGEKRDLSYWILVLPALGGAFTGILTHFFCKEAAGGGTDSIVSAFHNKEGKMESKVPFYKALATIATLGTGGSGGKEGPTAQIGAGFGSFLGEKVGAGARARRTLMLAGTAGGLGAIFQAPLGGAITAVEMMYTEDIESDSLVPCILSSVTAYIVYTSIQGPGSIFNAPENISIQYELLPFYIGLAGLCALLGRWFIRFFRSTEVFFSQLKIHPIGKPVLGGIFVGGIGFFFPEILGSGIGVLQSLISSEQLSSMHWDIAGYQLLFLLMVLKIVSASLTVGSGGSAGLLGPAFFIGAMLGGFWGMIVQSFFPLKTISLFPFLMVGMGSFFAGVASAPIAGMIMVSDMMGSYALLPLLMLGSVLSAIFSGKKSIYKNQIKNRFLSPAHHWDMNQDVMDRITIDQHFKEFRKFAVIPENKLLLDLHKEAPSIQASDFILVSEAQDYKGIISLRKSRVKPEDSTFLQNLITCEELAEKVPGVSPKASLGDALRILLSYDVDKIAILKGEKCLGYLRYVDLLQAYQSEIRLHSRN